MKINNFLKVTLITLIIIGISIISFLGIYVDYKNTVKNIVPDYILGRDLKGFRRIELEVNNGVQTIKYNAEGAIIEESDTETEVARTEEIKVNPDDVLTKENYEKTKQIIQKRLEEMQIKDYIISQNVETGNILVEIPENDLTDTVVYQLMYQGKFEIVDNDTKEVLMTNDDIKSVKAGYGTTASGYTSVFINFQFNKEGTRKFKDITNTYIEIDSENNQEQDNSNIQTNTESTTTTDDEEDSATKAREIIIRVDGQDILTTHFDKEVSNGILQLSFGSTANLSAKDLSDSLIQASNLAILINNGKTPVVYEVSQNRYVVTDITMDRIYIVLYVILAILIIGLIFYVVKYKMLGLKAAISLIGYMALLLICIRLFNVEVSISAIGFIILSIILDFIVILSILHLNKQKENIKVSITDTIKKYLIILVPAYIIAICLTVSNLSGGAALFWGITINILYNLLVTRTLLTNNK